MSPIEWIYGNAGTAVIATGTAPCDIDLTEEYGEGVIMIDASKSKNGINIIGNDLGNSIKGGRGADTITGGTGNDTVSLGSGADVYIYNGGNDLIQDYHAGTDTIQVNTDENELTFVETVGSNVIYSFNNGEGTITVKHGKSKEIIITDANGVPISCIPPWYEGWKFNSSMTMMYATIAAPEDIDLTKWYGFDDVWLIDARRAKFGVEIIGNDLGNCIYGGNGADTIIGGTGNDTIISRSGADVYIYTGGDDLIQDYGVGADTIQVNTDENELTFVETVGSNVIYSFNNGEGTITVKGGRGKSIKTVDQNGDDLVNIVKLPDGWTYTNSTKTQVSATVAGAEDLDLREEYGEGVIMIDASKSKNGINIIGNDLDNSIKGGRGADCIIGGAGNDTVSLGGGADVYVYTGGNDLIQDYHAGTDSIQIDTNEYGFISAETINTNVIYSFNNGEGTITVKGGRGKSIKTVDQNGDDLVNIVKLPDGWTYTNSTKTQVSATVAGSEDLDLRKEYGKEVIVVDGSKSKSSLSIIGNNEGNAIKGGKSADLIEGGTGDDTISLGAGADTYIYTGGNDFIQDFATIDVIQLNEEVALEHTGTVGSNFVITTNQGTITLAKAKNKAESIYVYNAEGEQVLPKSDTIPTGWKISGNTFTATIASADNEIDLTEDYGLDISRVDASKITGGVVIVSNSDENFFGDFIKCSKGADTIYGGSGRDTVSLGGGADVYVYNGGDDLIQDYGVGKDSIQFANGVTLEAQENVGTNVVLTTNVGNITLKGSKNKNIIVMDEDGHPLIMYPYGDWNYNSNRTQLIATVTAPYDIDLTESYGESVITVDASKSKNGINIIGNDLGNSIKGGRGADTITGGTGNDTVSLGSGADVYVYTGGNDLIQDYNAVDKIQIGTDNYELTAIEKIVTNVVYSFNNGEGTITVKSGQNKNITIIDSNGNDASKIYPTIEGVIYDSVKTAITLDSSFAGTLQSSDYNPSVMKIYASKVDKAVKIFGNDTANTINGGIKNDTIYGGAGDDKIYGGGGDDNIFGNTGDDTLNGDAGNDTLTGGAGNDVFIYVSGKGNDVIADYEIGDKIKISGGSITKTTYSDDDVIFKIGAGSITVKDGNGKNITIVDSNNNTTTQIYTNMVSSADLFEDDNFISSTARLDDISEITTDNYSVTEIQSANYETLAQDNNYLVYNSEKDK